MATVAVTGAVALSVVAEPASAAPAAPSCDSLAAAESQALELAAACDRAVVVDASRTEYTQVVAQPDGRLQLESSVVPQRTHLSDGSWADVDLTLHAGEDGLLRPMASVADVAFSAGGDTPLVTLTRASKSMQFSWPGRLPSPVLSGDSATYPAVMPDVDLVVRATPTGFTHVLVVRSAKAAKNPALREVALKLGGDAKLSRAHDGSLQAVAGGAPLAQAEPAIMWDSSAGKRQAAQDRAREASSARAAGDGARTAKVATRVAQDGGLRLVPDAVLLDAPSTSFPVYVDPAWSVARSKWAYATSDGCTNTDYTYARVGYSPEGPCVGSRFRSYFEFPTTSGSISLKGKHIESAYVQMKLRHSWSCTDTSAHMYLTPVINATMKASFSTMTLKTWLDSAAGHANKDTGCSDSPQDDMYMNFSGSNVTTQTQTAATGGWPSLTVGFCACNDAGQYETSQDRWKKFYPGSAKLVVDYDSIPGKPTGLQVAGVACLASGSVTIGTTAPTFSAVYPDADSGQTLTGTYQWIEVPAGGMKTVTDTYPTRKTAPPTAPASANGRATTAAVNGLANHTYAFRVTAVDPAPYSQWSGWSSTWCQFSIDTSVPPAPTITCGGLPIEQCPVPGPGEPITFTLSSTTSDVTKFRYSWTGPPGTPHTLRSYAGDGAGGFSSSFTTPPGLWDTDGTVLSPGDMDGDGKPDVIFRRSGDASLHLVRGNGTGGFSADPEELDAGNWSTAQYLFSPGDFTGDGKPDLLYRDQPTQNLFMRRGTADGGLEATAVQVGTGWSSATWIFSPGDFNGDGKPDVLYRKADGSLMMVRGNGTGGWITGLAETIGAGWNGAALFGKGDFSGDGKTDMLYRINSTGETKLIRGNGTGGWLESTGVLKGTIPTGGAIVVPGDFSGDGKKDILVTIPAAPNYGEVTASGTTTKTASITVNTYKYGKNILWARAVDSTGNLGAAVSTSVTVPRRSEAVARWRLETDPTRAEAEVVKDSQPSLGDTDSAGPLEKVTDLSPTNVAWQSDAHLISEKSAAFNGTSSTATTAGPVIYTTDSFSVAAWVRLAAVPSSDMKLAMQEGVDAAGFELGVRQEGSPLKPYWSFVMKDTPTQSSTTRRAIATVPITAADTGRWVHLAGVYDKLAGKLRLYVDGTMVDDEDRAVAPWSAAGRFVVGRSATSGGVAGAWWNGNITDVQVFNRVLVNDDFTGKLGSDPDSGGVDEPGVLSATEVGRWDFNTAHPCHLQDLRDNCDASDGTGFARWLALQRGVSVESGNRGNGLYLDGYFFPDENPEPGATQEWAHSARLTGWTDPDIDGNEFSLWQAAPVLRTDQSFTVSAWGYLDNTTLNQTLISQAGNHESGMWIKYDPTKEKWVFMVTQADDTAAAQTATSSTQDAQAGVWTHLAGVYDAGRKQLRLYVNGDLSSSVAVSQPPMASSGPLQVGRTLWHDKQLDYWHGGVDDIGVYQGAMSNVDVKKLYESQLYDDPEQP
ncbi:LamG-like jellyroll fold domain-containing protein [Micromonospora sp. NPDC049275]|uniref:LamG-like jellyroll fold domain-containing protein n=1 Tax=Micromonospora sp. NPDC049275 TaxID=3364268 RepID=UPI00371050B4